MTENNKELKACRDAFEKWFKSLIPNEPLIRNEYSYSGKFYIAEWFRAWAAAWQVAYNLHHNEAPTGELPLHAGTGLNTFVTRLEKDLKATARGGAALVNPRDLKSLLYHFIRLDNEFRSHHQKAETTPTGEIGFDKISIDVSTGEHNARLRAFADMPPIEIMGEKIGERVALFEGYLNNNVKNPTGEIGDLIERIEKIVVSGLVYSNSEGGNCYYRVPVSVVADCKAQLQQAQKMREALEVIYNAITYGNTTYDAIREVTIQALNNKG